MCTLIGVFYEVPTRARIYKMHSRRCYLKRAKHCEMMAKNSGQCVGRRRLVSAGHRERKMVEINMVKREKEKEACTGARCTVAKFIKT